MNKYDTIEKIIKALEGCDETTLQAILTVISRMSDSGRNKSLLWEVAIRL